MYKDIKRYLLKLAIFCIPFLIFVAWYIYLDPFQIIWHYDNYFVRKSARLSLNHGFVALANLDNHYDEYQWDSYIFGNSRSRYWNIDDWEQFLPKGSKGYHFDASGESLFGIEKKVQYLDKQNIKIKNAIIVMDAGVIAQVESSHTVHVMMIPPKLVNYSNWFEFQTTNFGVFCNFEFIKICMEYRQGAEVTTQEDLINGELFDYDYRSNQVKLGPAEKQISEGKYYTDDLVKLQFSNNEYPDSISPVIIGEKQKEMFEEIERIFKKHGTSYRIVISPLWDKIKLNPADVIYIRQIFGANNVFDFSGVNKYTSDFHNYYEHSHYRSGTAKKIMKEIYSNRFVNKKEKKDE